MLKKSASFVLASLRDSTYQSKPTGGKVTIRSHVIEASGSSEAWYVPPRLLARCGRADGLFEHPAIAFLCCALIRTIEILVHQHNLPITYWTVSRSIGSDLRDVNEAAFFLFPQPPVTIRCNAEHVHHGTGGREGGTSPAPDRTSGQAGGSFWREISYYRFHAQQLPQLRASKSRSPHPVQITLSRPSYPHGLEHPQRRTRRIYCFDSTPAADQRRMVPRHCRCGLSKPVSDRQRTTGLCAHPRRRPYLQDGLYGDVPLAGRQRCRCRGRRDRYSDQRGPSIRRDWRG